MSSKFKPGDKVKIINYGSVIWMNEDGKFVFYDMTPELVRQTAIVNKVDLNQGKYKYSLIGPNKTAWYNENQLELNKEI